MNNKPKVTKTEEGKPLVYKGLIQMATETKFKLWGRIKILLGKPIITNTEIYTKELVNPVGQRSVSKVLPLFMSTKRYQELINRKKKKQEEKKAEEKKPFGIH